MERPHRVAVAATGAAALEHCRPEAGGVLPERRDKT